MISGLAPGSCAATVMVAKSTCGKEATGSFTNAMQPAMMIATVIRMVATGRLMKKADRFTEAPPFWGCSGRRRSSTRIVAPAGQRTHR